MLARDCAIIYLLQPFRLQFFSNLTQGDALGCCNFEPFGLPFRYYSL